MTLKLAGMRVLLLCAAVAACSAPNGPTTTVGARAAATGPAAATRFEVNPTVAPPVDPTDLQLESIDEVDKKGDLVNQVTDRKASGPAYVDMISLGISIDPEELVFELAFAKDVPENRSSDEEELNYTFVFETTGDRNYDYWVSLENREDGSWSAILTDWSTGLSESGDAFPGTLSGNGTVNGYIGLEALGTPSRLRMCVVTQRASGPGSVTAQDDMPGKNCLGGDNWIEIPLF